MTRPDPPIGFDCAGLANVVHEELHPNASLPPRTPGTFVQWATVHADVGTVMPRQSELDARTLVAEDPKRTLLRRVVTVGEWEAVDG